ncbi:DUF1801 domain-containing protein [Myroides sp. JBRI-B21084]|uniref:DUF1801 domain-containing protein n=1 Tax=Myroides sp. JBRI-B21084 TaxID=3119977 RepID=UPI0026E3954D|nr:DUF1801 domain-containing protein [Paenimyroides cloacae]WKW46922.1 DUF1801 domain-containing protein [Paenimyroides cloacae]
MSWFFNLRKMDVSNQINRYINSLSTTKAADILTLHNTFLNWLPNCKLWFFDGKNTNGKVIANPNIGYGIHQIKYTDNTTKPFYKIGLSANTGGISVYVFGTESKTYLADKYSTTLGKAKITGYCIKFKSVNDINLSVLNAIILDAYKK